MRNERIRATQATRADMLFAAPWSAVEKMLLLATCAAPLFFALVTPPFQAPDENQHL